MKLILAILGTAVMRTAAYEVVESGTACDHITDVNECQFAAAFLGLQDTVATVETTSRSSSRKPPSCYYSYGNRLKFNEKATNTGACSSMTKCLCKTGDTPPAASALSDAYKLIQAANEDCEPLQSIEQCEMAAAFLGLKDVSASVDGGKASDRDPPFCYYERNRLKFNENGDNMGGCSKGTKCVCAGPPAAAAATEDDDDDDDDEAAPIAEFAAATESDAVEEASGSAAFVQLSSGACPEPITTKEACQAAAVFFELDDSIKEPRTRESTRESSRGNSTRVSRISTRRPPFCSVSTRRGKQGKSLRFDAAGDNTGECSERNPCLCIGAAAEVGAMVQAEVDRSEE